MKDTANPWGGGLVEAPNPPLFGVAPGCDPECPSPPAATRRTTSTRTASAPAPAASSPRSAADRGGSQRPVTLCFPPQKSDFLFEFMVFKIIFLGSGFEIIRLFFLQPKFEVKLFQSAFPIQGSIPPFQTAAPGVVDDETRRTHKALGLTEGFGPDPTDPPWEWFLDLCVCSSFF